jgi:hypothetical protein
VYYNSTQCSAKSKSVYTNIHMQTRKWLLTTSSWAEITTIQQAIHLQSPSHPIYPSRPAHSRSPSKQQHSKSRFSNRSLRFLHKQLIIMIIIPIIMQRHYQINQAQKNCSGGSTRIKLSKRINNILRFLRDIP